MWSEAQPIRFFIIGAQRCGTTYLAERLDRHPDVCIARPLRPEPKVFLDDEAYARGCSWYDRSYFAHCTRARAWGEKSTSYLEYAEVASRIQARFPNARLIVSLRDPVERALSNYAFSWDHGVETRSLEEVFYERTSPPRINTQRFSVDPFNYLGRGEYLRHLRPYLETFGAERILILLYEHLIRPDASWASIYRFIGVDPDQEPAAPREALNDSSNQDLTVPEAVRGELRSYYGPWNQDLARLLDIDLTEWQC